MTSRRSWLALLALAMMLGAAGAWWAMGRANAVTGADVSVKGAAAPASGASAATPASSSTASSRVFELTPSETLVASTRTMAQTLAITGTVKAVKTALVKVRVAGEITQFTLREGDTVKAGQVVARIDPGEAAARLRQVSDQAESARAQVDIAQRQYDNNQSLMQQGFISKTALENASASLAGAKATFQAAKAAVELAQRNLDDTVLRAPIRGVVASKGVQNGERAGIEARVIEIVDLSQMELEAALPVEDAAAVRIGQTARVVVEGATDAGVTAKVVRINPSVQAGSRSVMVYLSVAPHPALKNGVFAQGDLALGQTSGVAVPVSAIRLDKPKPYVQVLEGDAVVHKTVLAGARGAVDGQPFAVVEGLPAGTMLLSGTVGVLREGTRVKVTAPATGK